MRSQATVSIEPSARFPCLLDKDWNERARIGSDTLIHIEVSRHETE
jgi:hypothetical protein